MRRERERKTAEARRDTFTCEKEGERRTHVRTHARTEDGSGVPYTVTFVKARLSPYTGNVRDGRHLYRVRLKSQECCFLSRLLYTYTHPPPYSAGKQRRGRKAGVREPAVVGSERVPAFRAFQLVPLAFSEPLSFSLSLSPSLSQIIFDAFFPRAIRTHVYCRSFCRIKR